VRPHRPPQTPTLRWVIWLAAWNALQVRTDHSNHQLDPSSQSTLRWHHFLAMKADALVG